MATFLAFSISFSISSFRPTGAHTHTQNSQCYKSAKGLRHACSSLATYLSFLLYKQPTLNSSSAQYRFQLWDCFSCCSSQSSRLFLIVSMADVEVHLNKLHASADWFWCLTLTIISMEVVCDFFFCNVMSDLVM